jgi:vitamin B12 transporter
MRAIPLAALAAPLLVPPAAAQDAPLVLDPIIVDVSRLDTPAAETGTSISVITREEIDRRGFVYVLEALETAPGVDIARNGGPGAVTGLRIRGISGDRVVVLIDGVPVNDPASPGGAFNFAALRTFDVERIEVLKGPQSTLWGSDAIGGVVNIVTRRAGAGAEASGFAEYGSYDTYAAGGALSWGGERADLRVSLDRVDSDGFSRVEDGDEADGFDATSASFYGGLELGRGARLAASGRWQGRESEFDAFGLTDAAGRRDVSDEASGSVGVELPLFDGRLDNALYVGGALIDRESITPGFAPGDPDNVFSARGRRLFARYQGEAALDEANRLLFGAEHEIEEAEIGEEPERDASITGVFGLWETRPVDDLVLSFGLRRDETDAFGGETTGRVAASWAAVEALTLRASAGRGFKAPTLTQRTFAFDDFVTGARLSPDPGLGPETSLGADVGFDLLLPDERGALGATAFVQRVDDQIAYLGFDGVTYANLDETESAGVEVYANLALSETLSLDADYTYLDAEDLENDRRLFNVPRHSGELALIYQDARWLGSAAWLLNGEELDVSGREIGGWGRVDLKGAYAVTPQAQLYARVENLFDNDYQQVFGFATPGLSAYVGLEGRF